MFKLFLINLKRLTSPWVRSCVERRTGKQRPRTRFPISHVYGEMMEKNQQQQWTETAGGWFFPFPFSLLFFGTKLVCFCEVYEADGGGRGSDFSRFFPPTRVHQDEVIGVGTKCFIRLQVAFVRLNHERRESSLASVILKKSSKISRIQEEWDAAAAFAVTFLLMTAKNISRNGQKAGRKRCQGDGEMRDFFRDSRGSKIYDEEVGKLPGWFLPSFEFKSSVGRGRTFVLLWFVPDKRIFRFNKIIFAEGFKTTKKGSRSIKISHISHVRVCLSAWKEFEGV